MLNRFRALERNARLYLLSNLLQAATTGAVLIVYNLYLVSLGYPQSFIGVALLVGTIGGAIGIIPANALVNRVGYRAMLLWSNIIGGVSIAVQILIPTTPVILITMLGAGASVAVILVVNTPLLTTYTAPSERTAVLGLNNALNFLAGIIGALLGGFLPDFFGRADVASSPLYHTLAPFLVAPPDAQRYELAMLAAGLLALPSIIPILLMREERPAFDPGSRAAAATAGIVEARVPLRKRTAMLRREARAIASGVIGRFTVTQSLVAFGAGLFVPYANLYFVETLHATTSAFGVLSSATAVAVAAANLLAAPLAARLGKVRSALLAQCASLVFLLVLGSVPVLLLASAAFIIRGFLMALTGPPLQANYMEAVPEQSRVLASSVYNGAYQILAALGAGVGGWLGSVAGNGTLYLAALPFYAASALLLLLWFGIRRPAVVPATKDASVSR